MSLVKSIVELLLIISSSEGLHLYRDEEMRIVKSIGNSLGINCFAFVQNHKSMEVIKTFSENKLFSVVIDLDEFEIILNDELEQREFFSSRKILITKERLNFTSALEKLSGVLLVSWIVFVKFLSDFDNSYIPVDTNFFIIQNRDGIVVNKAYNLKPGCDIRMKRIGILPRGNNQQVLMMERSKKIDFEKAKFKMLYFFSKEVCSSRLTKHVLDKMECFQQELMKLIAETLNFTIVKKETTERIYPYNYPNGSLSELFLILLRREVDISSGSYIINNNRLRDYDFVWPTFTTKSMMYVKYESSKSSWRAYIRPMQGKLWKAIISWIILTGILTQIFNEIRLRNFRLRMALIPEFMQSVFLSLQIFCNQGVHNMSNFNSSRIIFMGTLLLFVALYQAYSGFLISSLTVVVPDLPFTNLDEFFRDGTYKIITLNKGFHNYYVKKIFKQLKKNKEKLMLSDVELPADANDGIEMLCTRKKITYVEFRENIVQYDLPCRITELPKPMFYQSVGIGFPKNTPYREIINQQVSVFGSTGILHRMKKVLLSYVKLHERETSADPYINVSFEHIKSIFFLLGMGIVVSVFVFLLEIIWNSRINRNHKQKLFKRKHLKWK